MILKIYINAQKNQKIMTPFKKIDSMKVFKLYFTARRFKIRPFALKVATGPPPDQQWPPYYSNIPF